MLTHLEPPNGCTPIRLDRFSPLFNNAEAMGLRRVRPTHAYYYVFPLGRRELAKLAYFFDFDYEDGRRPDAYLQAPAREVQKWRDVRQGEHRPKLNATIAGPDGVLIDDTRACAAAPAHRLTGIDAELFLACDAAQSWVALPRSFHGRYSEAALRQAAAGAALAN